ncbi:MAG: pitrilysin family protein [Dehalococcoidales bacterium]|jgi:predicted Zn-dependent peptidase|nr:pitrilysin family protein [Dehalococcoidales bacterium]MDP7110285.1 pitrilysin family protein [Dehalococcoidales bacterium]MDP7310353.1 pitrilysin family protein [Dehalococcoidales bacterium]MDP7409969.1 pitrilysin family protein [Dehalococcoidales bacterium]MDP7675396.1 pitrilysin family protein [Dehalococcoidales bacterium]|tara:strand:- start:255 stop:1517 length:1263 start_codon:yes stop_codon:yes gene_type:complete
MYHKTTLDNGLRLITTTMPHTHSISLCFFVGIGSRYETEALAGVSHFIEHLCFKGTTKRATSGEISAAIEGVGGILNAGTNKELTIYWTKAAKIHFPLALDVLTDMILNSKFDPVEIERERQVVIEEIHMSKDSPSQRVNLLIDELLWPGHPLGRDTAGNKESMMSITRDAILAYLKRQYFPSNIVAALAGNIKHQEAVDLVSQATTDWTNQQSRPEYLPYQEQPNPRLLIEKRDTEQAHLCLAVPGLSLFDPRRFVLDLLNVILGEGMSSRLFTEIRDKLGLAYSIHSYTDHLLDSGSMIIYAGVDPKNLPIAIRAILEQLSLLKQPIPETELSKAKELIKGRLLLRMEDTGDVAAWAGGQEILTGRVLGVDQIIGIIDAITSEELRQLACELLVGKHLRLALVGPVTKEDSLEELLKL